MLRVSVIAITIVLTLFIASDVVLGQFESECSQSIECNTKYCRFGKCAMYGDAPDETGHNPCDTVRCKGGYTCTLQQVQCFTTPCLPIASCVCTPGNVCD